MPDTLHFLIPRLRLLPRSVNVLLIGNGACAWEREALAVAFPDYPCLVLGTLPGNSLAHRDVITLLLRANERHFGLCARCAVDQQYRGARGRTRTGTGR
jgi:hypothetical protein